MRQFYCWAPDVQKISIDCCPALDAQQQQRGRSSKCGQCQVDSWCRKLNTDIYFTRYLIDQYEVWWQLYLSHHSLQCWICHWTNFENRFRPDRVTTVSLVSSCLKTHVPTEHSLFHAHVLVRYTNTLTILTYLHAMYTFSSCGGELCSVTLNFEVELHLDCVKMNGHAKYQGQRSLDSKINARTRTHARTSSRLHYL